MDELNKINEVKKEEEETLDLNQESDLDDTHASEESGEPAPAEAVEEHGDEPAATPAEENEKMIPQSEVNNIVGRTRMEAREKARAEYLAEMLEKYGLKDESEMDGIFGKGQQYDVLNEDFLNQGNEFIAMKEENALLKSEVVPEKWEDAKLIIKGKGLDLTPETIASELATHPEWKGQPIQSESNPQQAKPMLEVLGDETESKPKQPTDDEIINKYFGI